jgi:hypothetical protein
VAGALACPTIIPTRVLGADALSKKIQMAQIGYGGMGHGDMSSLMNAPEVRYVAVCDVDRQRRENFREQVNKHYATQDCRIYNDYRELLARRDPVAPVEVGHRAISCGLLGEIAMLPGRKLRWNPEQQDFIGDPAASALLGRSYREPWKLEA